MRAGPRQGAGDARRSWRSVWCVCLLAGLGIAAATGAAAADQRDADPLSLGPLPPRPAAGPVRDRVIYERGPALRRARAASATRTYSDGDGHSIRIRVSDSYRDPRPRARQLAQFLGTVLHGDEMDALTVTLAIPGEIRFTCGVGALACYFPVAEEMVVSGEDGGPNQPPREFVIAHEYGHHVAANRSNKPWSALKRGTKRWSTHEDICRGIDRGRIHPARYLQNPGEAFAEAFAFHRFPSVIPWTWQIARPGPGAFAAIAADVRSPWTRRTKVGWSGRLNRNQRRKGRRVETPLDGRLKVKLNDPPGADFDLAVLAASSGRVLKRSDGTGRGEGLRFTVCGRRAVRVQVRRVGGAGAYDVAVQRP